MKLQVIHHTSYHYDAPPRAVVQSNRLFPSEFDGQTVLDWSVSCDGASVGSAFRDGAGDRTELIRVTVPDGGVTVTATGLVETRDLTGVLRGHRERVPPMTYLRATRVTRPDVAIGELAADAVTGIAAASVLERAHALAAAVAQAIVYTPEATNAHTTAAEALDGGSGVCQDHAHTLIAGALTLDIPARYVVGYLMAGAGEGEQADTLVGSEASHAWAELHVPDLGWVGFDAANRCCPDARYIRLCSGYDAFDAAPIRGLAQGQSRGEALDVTVVVTSVQQ